MNAEQIRRAAEVIADSYRKGGDIWGDDLARALDDAGLLAPTPMREEWGVDCYLGFEPEAYLDRRNAEKHLAYEGGSLLRRYVSIWEPADEGADQ
jgi:hypothetical protein